MEIGEGVKWVIGTVMALGGLLGIGKIVELRIQRKFSLADKTDEIHQSNQSHKYQFDQFTFQKFADRLEKVEAKMDDVQKELSETKEKLARSEEANKYLKETNERQERELVQLRTDRTILSQQVTSLTNIVTKLQSQIEKK